MSIDQSQHQVVQVQVQSLARGPAKHAHLGPHIDTSVQFHEHTDYIRGTNTASTNIKSRHKNSSIPKDTGRSLIKGYGF